MLDDWHIRAIKWEREIRGKCGKFAQGVSFEHRMILHRPGELRWSERAQAAAEQQNYSPQPQLLYVQSVRSVYVLYALYANWISEHSSLDLYNSMQSLQMAFDTQISNSLIDFRAIQFEIFGRILNSFRTYLDRQFVLYTYGCSLMANSKARRWSVHLCLHGRDNICYLLWQDKPRRMYHNAIAIVSSINFKE